MKIAQGNISRNIPQEIEDDLKKSSLTWGDVVKHNWKVINTSDPDAFNKLKAILGFTSYNGENILKGCNYILFIPYFGHDFSRVRLYPPLDGVKYLQPKNITPAPYILPQVAEIENKPHRPVIITEGEKKTLSLIKHNYYAIGLPGVWCFKNTKQNLPLLKELEEWNWKGRTVHIVFDSDAEDNVNIVKAEIELGLNFYARGAKVLIIRLPQPDHQNKLGVDDFIAQKGIDAFKELYNGAVTFFEAYSVDYYDEMIKRIAVLVDANILMHGQVELITSRLSKTWKVKKSAIDKDIGRLVEPQDQGETLIVEDLKPYEGEVSGAEIADEVMECLREHVYLDNKAQYIAITLWVLLTYTFEKFSILPMLLVTSPTMRCGKTTLLTILEGLTNKALIASNISPSAVFRTIEKYKPTLFLDEADTGLAENEELRGIINAGHMKRTAFVIRTGSRDVNFEPEKFNTFCPKAIALIGSPSNTWKDRSIHIKMERKPNNLRFKKLPNNYYKEKQILRRKLLKWASGLNVPEELESNFGLVNDRAEDNWTPLIFIAMRLGNAWLKKAKEAMLAIEQGREDDDFRIELLQDIKIFFDESGEKKVFSRDLVEYLNGLEDRPWIDYNHGRGLTASWMSRQLKTFGIQSKSIRKNETTAKGYSRGDFRKVFALYLPDKNVTTSHYSNHAGFHRFQNVTKGENVTFKNAPNSPINQTCDDVTFLKGGVEEKFFQYVVTKPFSWNSRDYLRGDIISLGDFTREQLKVLKDGAYIKCDEEGELF